uniref:E1A binding protein p400 n=1 Tax=Hippocampus comes TaxID=109280 RepID=A0A3Q2Y184_HIPCM
MHHGSGSQNIQRQLQRSKSVSGSEVEDQQQQQQQQQQATMAASQQQTTVTHPQSPVTTFSSASPSAPQSPNYQIIMSRSPVTGQNMNITLQNVGQMVTGNQQITLTPLPLQNPASPGFQHTTPQWRFEHAPSSYIQVTSPLPQPMQPQSPTQHSPVSLQGITRPGAPTATLGVCGQSPTRFVEAGMLVRQISLGSPSGSGHFVYQDGTGLAQIAPGTPGQIQLSSPGAPGSVRERRLSQPHSQTGGTIHHLGPQSPVATSTALSTLGSPGHITTSNLPPQISSIIQEQLGRPVIFDKTQQSVVGAVGSTTTASFSIPSTIPPSSPSLTSPSQVNTNNPLATTNTALGTVKKQVPKKLEEIAPSTPEIAQLRKQCLEHHAKKMDNLKEVFNEYLIELFFLQHLQGNMMDYLAFKKKPCVPLYTYLRQNDLDLEEEEEEEEQSKVINDEVLVEPEFSGFICKYTRLFLCTSALCLSYNLFFMCLGGMPPTPQVVQIAGQKQNQQQYDPSKGPPVQNAASLHTPPPQLPGRLPQGALPMTGLPVTLSQQAQIVESTVQPGGQLQAQVKVQAGGPIMASANPHTQLQTQLQQQMQSGLHIQLPPQQQQNQAMLQTGQAVSLLEDICIQFALMFTLKLRYNLKILHQRISELRKDGQWSASRLPKLVEAVRPKSHWDYLLEEMQWMAADFVQERRWKEAAAKKLARTCARYHQEQRKSVERSKKEKEIHLRQIASTIAREVEFFWSNIEQVVDIKLHFEINEKRIRALSLQEASVKGMAYSFHILFFLPPEAVLIDSLLIVDQFCGPDKTSSHNSEGKPARDISEVAAATELLLPKGTLKATSPAPFLLHGSLRKYQQIGVDWMVKLYKKHLNGILADETGLGKTVQTVAYMAHLAGQEGVWGPHLIVVRTCKLLNWEVEFKRWCPGLKILLYLGTERERKRWREANSFHVCVTSYKLMMKDRRHFLRQKWRHLVLDEVQLIKNMTEKHWETIFALQSEQRILLINTPLQNTLKELWTMIHFLMPGITRPYSDFPVKAGTDQNQDYYHKLVIRLHRMIQPFILRRSKREVEKQLPKKYEHILKCRLSSRQKSMYEDILTQPGSQEALKTGHFVSVLQVLMQLQRVCNHPDLVVPRETSSSYFCAPLPYDSPSLILEAMQNDSSKVYNFDTNLSLFDLISNENRLTRYQTEEAIPKLKVTQQLIEEIYSGPEQPPHPKPCPIKPMRLFQPVQYGTKPEGRLVAITSAVGQNPQTSFSTPTNSVSTTNSAQIRGKSPITTVASTATQVTPSLLHFHIFYFVFILFLLVKGGDAVKIAQLANIAGSQNRISQPETPVTLQFQGNKFTLSPSQLRQLTTGQPLQLQGNILQIVSAPGQQIIRPQGSMVMQSMAQAIPNSNASSASPSALHPALPTVQQGDTSISIPYHPSCFANQILPQRLAVESSEEKTQQAKQRLSLLFDANERRCSRRVLYGSDLLQACTVSSEPGHSALTAGGWMWVGRESCVRTQNTCVATTSALQSTLLSVEDRMQILLLSSCRLVCVVPTAVAPPPRLYAANPPILYTIKQKLLHSQLQESFAPHTCEMHHLVARHHFCSPDRQLMQMDSGKLEALAILLQKLRSDNRRVLIFTQMAKMLDILEAFLDYRQLTYVRVDESYSPDERQVEKTFNRNRQIFCSILTNLCCSSVGTMLDADAIIFYDTDLNPSMDARTQEWCDKIGRAKDIHIYRLESGNSIEEKLLKNGTKDLIREVAAQGTDYTLAFLTQRTIQDLFEVEAGSGEKVEEFVVLHQEPSASETISPKVARPYIQALHSINLEDSPVAEDVNVEETAISTGNQCEMADESESQTNEESSEIEELNAVMEQLTPIERYALNYLEYLHISDDETERLECSKRGWELQQLQKLKEEEQDQHLMEAAEELFTYTREDAYNMYVFTAEDGHTEIMPVRDDNLWHMLPPHTTPGILFICTFFFLDDNDIYIDSVMCLMYDTTPIPEAKLPPIYIRKEHKRLKLDPSAAARKKKKGHGETVIPPRSLFEKASMLKVRREGKDQKKNFSLKQQAPFAKPLPSLVKPAMEAGQDNPEWLISEDWALLQAVKQLLELPLNLTIVSPAHTPNWDLVSDVVNSCSRIYRSPKQCRNRYENVIIPREEGKLMYEANPKKKTKSIYKVRPLRTCQIYTQDDNATQIQLYNSRFELMKIIASKRSPPIKPLLGMNPFQKNPKHASVLAESGISYDKPLPPIQVASQRAERIAKEKKVIQLAQQQQQAGAPQGQTTPSQTQTPALISCSCSGLAAAVGGNVIVNTVAGVPPSPFQANKRLASPVIPSTLSVTQVVHAQQRAVTAAAPAEVVAIATGQGVRAVTPVTASAVVSTTLSPVQAQTRPLVTQVTPGNEVDSESHVLTLPTRVPTQGQIQAQAGQTAQMTLTKPPVVSVPAVVSSAGVTTLPVTVAGISVAIGQAQKTGMSPKCFLRLRTLSQVTVQAAQPTQQQQKVTYTTTTQLQPGIKPQFFTTSIAQTQKPTGPQQIQVLQQVAKLPQIVQQPPTVANIQQIVSSPQQPQTVTLTTSAPAQVQMIPAGTTTAQVVQQKLIQQQVVTAAASPQIQTPPAHSPAQQESSAPQPVQSQQPTKGQARQGGIRAKPPAKPSGGSS